MVIPVGLPDAQQLLLAEKDLNGRIATKEIMPVPFSLLEGVSTGLRSRCPDQLIADLFLKRGGNLGQA
jgi:hypothetical protein